MLFIYFISLLYLTHLTFCDITSESEAINKIIGNILLKAERKNAETQDFIWDDDFTITDNAKTRSPKRLFDYNPFMRTQYPRSKPTLKLHDLLPGLNKPRQGHKEDEKIFRDDVSQFGMITGNQPSKESVYESSTTYPTIKENFGTSTGITNFIIKIQRKTVTPVTHQIFSDKLIPDGPHDKMFSDSIFTTPRTNSLSEDITAMHKEPTTTSGKFSFDSMQSITPTMSTKNNMKIFHYDESTSTKEVKYLYSPSSTSITHADIMSLEDAEDLVSSVPNYEKTSETLDDFIKTVTEPEYHYILHETTTENSKYNDMIEDITNSLQNNNNDKLLNEYGAVKVSSEDKVTNDNQILTPTHCTATSDSPDEYLSIKPEEQSLKNVFSLDDNYGLTQKEDKSDWFKIESSNIEEDKQLDTTENNILERHGPCTANAKHIKEKIKITETNLNDELDHETTTAKIESESTRKKGIKSDQGTQAKETSTDNISSKRLDSFSQGNYTTSKKVNVADDKKTTDVEKVSTIQGKHNDAVDTKSKVHEVHIDAKQHKLVNEKPNNQISEGGKISEIASKKNKVPDKVIEISEKASNTINKVNKVSDNKANTAKVINNKPLKQADSITTKSDITNKKSKVNTDKNDNSSNKKGNGISDLYDDILKIYGSLKETNEKGPQRIQDTIAKHLNWESVKRFFGHDRVCNCKCRENRTLCRVCAASDAVMRELMFEFNNLAEYMNTHCTEIQTFFWMNPTGGKRLRDTVHKIDRTMQDYYKRVRGKCTGKACNTFATYLDKRRNVDKKKRERKYLLELLHDLEISDV